MSTEIPSAQKQDEPYAGANNATIALGKGYIMGWAGKVIGAITGGTIAALSTRESNYLARKGTAFLESLSIKSLKGKWVVVTGGAMVGAIAGHYVGLAVGTKKGYETAQQGRDQFERIKAERDMLTGQLDDLETKNDALHEKLGTLDHTHGKDGKKSFSDKHRAQKDVAEQAVTGR